jgi:DNA-binding MarR family transcriptional regulator
MAAAATAGKPATRKRRPSERDAWLGEFTQSLTATTRALHSPHLYAAMVRRAGVPIRPNLFTVLTRLHELQPARLADVADNTGYDPSTVSRQIAELVDLGYVSRVRDTNDARARVLTVTDAGQATVDAVWAAWHVFLGEITAGWAADERRSFLEQLQRFGTVLIDAVDHL